MGAVPDGYVIHKSRLRERLADPYRPGSLAHKARTNRWKNLAARFPLQGMRVLDIGGIAKAWEACPTQPGELVLLNVRAIDEAANVIEGDACDPPAELMRERFDLVYSNSVIEHVGGHLRRHAFAETVRELAPHYWVQTPNRHFPVEPHWLFPGFQWLPTTTKAFVSRHWPFGGYRSPKHPKAVSVEHAMAIELLTRTELAVYFPDAQIETELKVKSLIAVR